jgi:hypothetical protein
VLLERALSIPGSRWRFWPRRRYAQGLQMLGMYEERNDRAKAAEYYRTLSC